MRWIPHPAVLDGPTCSVLSIASKNTNDAGGAMLMLYPLTPVFKLSLSSLKVFAISVMIHILVIGFVLAMKVRMTLAWSTWCYRTAKP